MKKIIISAIFIAAASFSAFSQSNTKGTVHVGLGWGLSLGGATIKSGPSEDKAIGGRSNYGIRASYGLGNAFSLGLFLRKEGAVYVSSSASSSSLGLVSSGIGVGLEGKLYAVNKDKFNMYFAPSFGFSSGKAYPDGFTAFSASTSGLNYGLTAGFNWYWASFIGMSLDLGYQGIALSGKFDGATENFSINGGGVYFGLGLVSKFGGE